VTEASSGVQLGTNKTMTITLEQEDGKIIALVWDDYADVDMDLFLWIGDEITELFFIASSANPAVDPQAEIVFIPSVIQDAAFGTSYTYYSGTQTPMEFEAQFIDFANGQAEPQANYDVFPGTYTLANRNAWDSQGGTQPVIAQTFTKTAGVFAGYTNPIVIPATGSRTATVALPNGVKKMNTKSISTRRSIR